MDYSYDELVKLNGHTFKADRISTHPMVTGKLVMYDDRFFLCQNDAHGSEIPDDKRLGYDNSWNITNYGEGFDDGDDKVEGLEISLKEPATEKVEPTKYIVKYDLISRDPIREFTNLKDLNDWLERAVVDRNVKFESIKVFEVVNMKTPKIKVSLVTPK